MRSSRVSAAPSALPQALSRRGQGQGIDARSRRDFESHFGSDFSGVRVHTDRTADRAAREIGARAFTTGRDIYFAQGQYHPLTPQGRWLLAHELTHVVQQREGVVQRAAHAPSLSPTDSHWEREADAAANAMAANRPLASHITPAPTGPPQRDLIDDAVSAGESLVDSGRELVNDAGELVNEAGEVIQEAADTVMGFAREVWDFAQNIAAAIGGAVSISGTRLTVTVGSISTDAAFAADLPLPAWELFIPFAGAAFTTGIVTIHGELGLQITAQPMASIQLGPGSINGVTLVIDPVSGTYSGSGSYTIATALQLGAELRAGLRGQVGLIIAWPDPPLIIPIELAGIEAGLAARAIGTAVGNTTVSAAFAYGGGSFAGSYAASSDLGFALDMGLAGYGQLDVLGITLCRLYWPLLQKSYETTTHLDIAAAASISTAGPSLSFSASAAKSPGPAFSDLPLALSRELFADECPVLETLCSVLHLLGLMPRDQGVVWPGAPPGGPMPGPLPNMYPRDPGLPSGAKCRGACGPDCDYCSKPKTRYGCEKKPDGSHQVWKYPNYQNCGAHAGCKQHDQCYDWCGRGGPGGIGPFACRRWCDLECLCDYRASTCVGWAFGRPPYDESYDFSDPPVPVGSCFGNCPGENKNKEGDTTGFSYCLPTITLWDGISISDSFTETTKPYRLFQKTILIPEVFIPVRLTVQAQGSVTVDVGGTMGPITLEGACLDMDPASGIYRGRAELHMRALAFIEAILEGRLIGTVDVPCIATLAQAFGILRGRGRLEFPIDGSVKVDLTCQNGMLVLNAAAFIEVCAKLKASLEAEIRLIIASFEVYTKTWTLAEREWTKCWNWKLGATSGRLPLPGGGSGGGAPGAGAAGGAGGGAAGAPAAAPQILLQPSPGFGGGKSGGGGAGSTFPDPGTGAAMPQLVKDGIDAKETINEFLDLAKALETVKGAGSGADMPTNVEDLINTVCPVEPKDLECPKAKPTDITKITMTGTDRGETVKAEPLTQKPDPKNPPSNPDGCTYDGAKRNSAPSCILNSSERNRWKRGHLLHGPTEAGRSHLNGPGTCPNIIMVDTSLNKKMRDDIEAKAIDRLKKNEVLFYEATATPFSNTGDLRFIAKSITAKFGCMDPATGDKKTIHSNTYENKGPPPAGCTDGTTALPPGPAAPPPSSGGGTPVQPKRLPGHEEKGTRVFQAKYVVNSANDHFEREADRAADSVIAQRTAPKLTPLTSGGLGSGLQRAGSLRDAPERISASGGPRAPPRRDPVSAVLENPGNGSPLPATTRAPIEASFGEDLSHVRVHTGPQAEAATASIGARAFTSGHNIWMGRGQSPHDHHLMAHEAAHVVQQAGQRGQSPAHSSLAHAPTPHAAAHPAIARRRRPAGSHPHGHAPPVQRACCGGGADKVQRFAATSDDTVQRTTAEETPVQRGIGDTLAEGFWSLVRRLAPNLEPILREISEQGIVGFLRNRIRAGMSSIFAALHDRGGGIAVLGDTFQRLIGVAGELMGQLAAGNCEPVFAAVRQLGSALEEMCGSAWNAITDFFQPVGDFFSDLWQSFGAPVLQWLQETGSAAWEYISGLGATLWGYIQPIKDSIASTLGDAWGWVKRQLGLGESEGENEGGLMQWVQQKAQDAWDSLAEYFQPIIAPIQAAVARVREILPLDAIFSLRDRVTAWLQRTAQSVSAMEPEGGVVEQQTSLRDDILPGVLATIDSVGERITAAGSWVAEKVGVISVSAVAMLEALEGNTLLGVAARALGWLRERIAALVPLVQDRVLGLFATATRALAAVRRWIRPIFDTLVELATVVQDVAGRVGNFVMGALFGWIPACIREPIKNFILTQILTRIPIFAQLAEIPNIWARVQSVALRILRQVFVNGDLIGAAWTFFRTMLEIIGLPPRLIVNIVTKAATALADILGNPVRFLLTLLGAVAEGFRRFFSNILTHLTAGLAGWLFGACAEAGIEPPRDLTLRSVLGFVLQIFDLTVDRIFARIALRVGDAVAQRLRRALEFATGAWEFISTLVNEGPPGLWRYVREQLGNLWSIVLNAAIQWIMGAVITTGSRWLLSLLDASGITPVINSIIAIYRAIESAVQYMVPILQMVERVLDAVGEIANGVVDTAAGFLENTLARGLPIAIGFIANQLGLGNVGRRVREIVDAIRERVDQALDWVIDRAIRLGQSTINALRSGARAVGGAVRSGVAAVAGWLGLRRDFTSGGQTHHLYFRGSGSSAQMIVESDPTNLEDFIPQAQALPANAGKGPLFTEVRQKRARIRTLQALSTLTPAQETEMENAVNRISVLLAQVTFPNAALGGAAAGPIPRTQVTWTGSSVGEQVVARPLTREPGNTTGSIAQDVLPDWSCMPAAEARDYWVRAHLLHGRTSSSGDRNLHGPGNQGWNLIISDKRLNGAMSRRAEQPALARIYNNNEILYYRVSARPAASAGHRRSFAESITVTWGPYDPATGSDGSPIFSETFDNERDIPTTCN